MARNLSQRVEQRANDDGGEVSRRATSSQEVRGLINQLKPEIARAVPRQIDADRFARIALTVFRQTPDLANCDVNSFLGALMTCAQLGLEPGPLGEAYLVPFGRKVTFIPGYRGLVKLAWQSGQLQSLAAHTVNERDDFDYAYGLEPVLVHRPRLDGERGAVIAVYAVANFRDGGNAFVVLSRADVEAIRDRSRAAKSGPWVTDWDAMARKTAVRQLARWLPMSTQLGLALAHDESVRTNLSADALDEAPEFVDAEVVEPTEPEVVEPDQPTSPSRGEQV